MCGKYIIITNGGNLEVPNFRGKGPLQRILSGMNLPQVRAAVSHPSVPAPRGRFIGVNSGQS